MKLSVIIPTYQRIEILRSTILQLHNSLANFDAEIIVINDDKKNDITQFDLGVEGDNIIKLNNIKSGAASARNYGSYIAKGEILLFLDDDILINPYTIASILKIHNEFDKIASTPIWEYSDEMKILLKQNPFGRFRLLYDYSSIRGSEQNKINPTRLLYSVSSLASFCLSIKRNHYHALNGMDENFPYAGCEDQEFSERAKNENFQLILDEKSIVKHNETDRIEKEKWFNRQHNGVQGFVRLAMLYPEKKKLKLWYENTPTSINDNNRLVVKKILKFILRQAFFIKTLEFITSIFERIHISDKILFKFYKIQTGVYINKGFNYSYKKIKNARSSNNSQ